MSQSAAASHLKVATDFSIRRMLRSTAGGLLKGARQRAVPLNLKAINRDGYPGHRA